MTLYYLVAHSNLQAIKWAEVSFRVCLISATSHRPNLHTSLLLLLPRLIVWSEPNKLKTRWLILVPTRVREIGSESKSAGRVRDGTQEKCILHRARIDLIALFNFIWLAAAATLLKPEWIVFAYQWPRSHSHKKHLRLRSLYGLICWSAQLITFVWMRYAFF